MRTRAPADRAGVAAERADHLAAPRSSLERVAPFVFLALWSGGYPTAKIAVEYASPITLVAVRFAITLLLFIAIALALRAPWPRDPRSILALATTGALIQAVYFVCCYLAFDTGVAAGALALLMALQPILTACVAGPLLGERVRTSQLAGLVLGLAGVVMVLEQKLAQGAGTILGVGFGCVALASITTGTLFQKRVVPSFDLWTGGVIQFAAATAIALTAALLLEQPRLDWSWPFTGALAYLVLGNSLTAVSLLNVMIRKGEASRVTSLLFLVPGGASLLAWLILDESMTGRALIGLVIGACGVALVMRPKKLW